LHLYVDTFPAFAQGQAGVKQYLKNLPPVHELRSVIIEAYLGIKQTAAGGAATFKIQPNGGAAVAGGANNDALTVAKALFANVYLKENEQTNAVNVKVVDAMICYGAQHGVLMGVGGQLRDGDAVPANGAANLPVRLEVLVDFLHTGQETPNKFTPGTEQATLNGGWEVSYDTETAANANLAALALANGTVIVTVNQIRLCADVHPTDSPIVAPTWFMVYDQEATENNERKGRFVELLVYEKSLPATLEAAVTTVNLYNDGLTEVRQKTPIELANDFARSCRLRDGVIPFEVARSCSPLRWVRGRVDAEMRELPITMSGRTINFQGSTATRNLVRHRIAPQRENLSVINAVLQMYGMGGADWRSLDVRFPSRDAQLDAEFATRVVPAKGGRRVGLTKQG
jgi:hypothetical protein